MSENGTGLDTEVAIVGGGFSGIGAAIALDRAGFRDLRILEAGDGIGGAWHWNRYPGVAVDIPSFSYQFSFEQRPDWSRVYAPGDELKGYAEHCVDAYGLRDRIRLGTEVRGLTWEEEGARWRLALGDGSELRARYVVSATGVFSQPKRPDIAGLDDFDGPVVHTARWDHTLDLDGKRVAVIGTGASAVQAVPTIAPRVEHLTVFQRTPIWCLPKVDGELPEPLHRALRRVPGLGRALRALTEAYVEATFPLAAHYATVLPMARLGELGGRIHLRTQVKDPVVREKLTPKYAVGCKRPGFSNDYLRAFNRPNVTLETDGIASVTPSGIRTRNGHEHRFDVLILATGFKVFDPGNMPPFPVAGREGLDLERFWTEHRYQAYEGASVPRFPNLWSILGPYAFNGSSYFNLIEHQSRHIVRCLTEARRRGAVRVEVSEEANRRFLEEMLGRRHRQVFFQGRCGSANSYYFDQHGDVPFRPSTTREVARRSATFPLSDYRFETAPRVRPAAEPAVA